MQLKFLISILFVVLFFSFVSVKSASAQTFTLSGTVKDNLDTAIVSTTIDVLSPGTSTVITSTTTDSNGHYTLSVSEGTYDVRSTPPSGSVFGAAIILNQNITVDKTINFVLVDAQTIVLNGYVYDSLGNTVRNQRVQFGTGFTTTDLNGHYSFSATPGTAQLSITNNTTVRNDYSLNIPGLYNIFVNNYSITQSTSNLNLTIPAKKVTVHVQDSSGNPVGGVSVSALNSNGVNTGGLSIGNGITNASSQFSNYGGTPAPITDSNTGNVELWLLPNNNNSSYTFRATPPSGSNYSATNLQNIVITDDATVTITLPQTITLSGYVYDSLGNTVRNQRVQFGTGFTTTDLNGHYSFSTTPGVAQLFISNTVSNRNDYSLNIPGDYNLFVNDYTLTQSTSNLNLTVPAKKVTVHVQDSSGNPMGGISVSARNLNGVNTGGLSMGSGIVNGSSQYSTGERLTDNSTGNVVLWLLPNNNNSSYLFRATPPSGSDYTTTDLSNVVVTDDTTLTIILPQTITISGHVYDSLGNGVPNQRVQFDTGFDVTDNTGFYSFSALAGTAQLSITNNTTVRDDYSLNIPGVYNIFVDDYSIKQSTSNLNLTLPAKKVTVHVQDSSGNPVGGISISALNVNGVNTGGLSMGNGINNASSQFSSYGGTPAPITDNNNGKLDLWLLPNNNNSSYTFRATPPSGSIFTNLDLQNIQVTGDQTEVISLQFIHEQPVTAADLVTDNGDGTYSDPTTVTLSATAASGFTIANTYYTVDGGAEQTYVSPFTVTGGGEHNITYWSVDNVGVPESPKITTFPIHVNEAPVVDKLSNVTLNEGDTYPATGSFTDTDSTSWTATVDYGDGQGIQSLPLSGNNFSLSHTYEDNGVYTVTVSVKDDQEAEGIQTATVTVNNVAPSVGAIDVPITPIAIGESINVLANFTDPGILDTHTASWAWGDGDTSNGVVDETNGSGSVSNSHSYSLSGTFTITLTVTDKDGDSGQSQATVIVNSPPVASAGGSYTVNEGSNVALAGSGTDPDGDTLTYAWDLDNNGSFETAGQNVSFEGIDGPDSVTVVFQVCDEIGICDTDEAIITINNVVPTVSAINATMDPVVVGTQITATATFSDPGTLDTHAASWNWGDGNTTSGTINNGIVSDTHIYTQAGVYEIILTVTDSDGDSGDSMFQYLVVYDPTAGFLTGAGKFNSPSPSGVVKFGVNAKYTGTGTPTGQAKINFDNANIELDSISFQWLVVSGAKATLKGAGTVNGTAGYSFIISGIDGSQTGGNSLIRVKVTDSLNNVIYDTQPGAPDTANPTTPLSNGNIKVH